MNGLPLNETFLFVLEWGYALITFLLILFTLWTAKKISALKGAMIWLAVHFAFMIGTNFLFWMGIRDQSGSTTPIDNLVDQVQFLLGVAALLWLMGMLCLVISIQMIKDHVAGKKTA